jgi:hypothetical protein
MGLLHPARNYEFTNKYHIAWDEMIFGKVQKLKSRQSVALKTLHWLKSPLFGRPEVDKNVESGDITGAAQNSMERSAMFLNALAC